MLSRNIAGGEPRAGSSGCISEPDTTQLLIGFYERPVDQRSPQRAWSIALGVIIRHWNGSTLFQIFTLL